jgi:hypothetical protein
MNLIGTSWFAADAANAKPGSTVIGDGAVGLLGVLSAMVPVVNHVELDPFFI